MQGLFLSEKRATRNDPFKDFKQLYEERNFIQSSGLEGAGKAFWKRSWKAHGSIPLSHMLGWWGNLSTAGVTTKSLYHISECSQEERISCVCTRTALLFQGKGLSTVYLKKTISCLKSADSLLPDHSLEYNI